jgi:hypothetical protein
MLSGYGADRALSALGRQKPAQNPSRTPGSLRYMLPKSLHFARGNGQLPARTPPWGPPGRDLIGEAP